MLESCPNKCYKGTFRVFVVIVLYKMRPNESTAFQTLQTSISRLQKGHKDIQILLYDNTPGECDPGFLPKGVQYVAAWQNAGLAAAYNCALSIAKSKKCTWLLTLDQDTILPPNYLFRVSEGAVEVESNNEVAAIVPKLSDAGVPLSPSSVGFFGRSSWPSGYVGVGRGKTDAYNSASCFRVSALKQIGGFNPYFWLDFLDAYVYRQFYCCGKKVYVLGDVEVEHRLSLLHRASLKPDRFRNVLQAESVFCDLYEGHIRGLLLTGRLLGRLWRKQRRGDSPAIRQLTWQVLKQRIFQQKTCRIQNWKIEMEQRMQRSSDTKNVQASCVKRPTVSVCMAAYNGEHYIVAQLKSILSQLAVDDEVIVVDDASTDGTRQCVQSLQDGRIRFIEHGGNMGVLHTFEDAIRVASGQILFLSDQDDLWKPQKVEVILNALCLNPDVTLIATDTAIIDSDGTLLIDSYFSGRGGFRSGLWANLVRNHFGGCTMAFRAELIREILPLPHKYDVLHDIWIGVRCSLSGHKTLYIDESLVLNRRHSSTVTGKKPLSIFRRVRIRGHLLLALADFWIRRKMYAMKPLFAEKNK